MEHMKNATMCLIIFEEKAEIQDQYSLSLNRDRDRLQRNIEPITHFGSNIKLYLNSNNN